jgi:ketosteroid isomerase-like protein
MPANPGAVLALAIEASVTGDVTATETAFTEDVVGWSPNLSVTSRAELEAEFAERVDALSNIVFSIDTLDVIGNKAIAEWRLAADHTGPLELGDGILLEPSGQRLVLAGASFAEFRGEQICSFRHYFDDAALIEQMLMGIS